MRQTLSRASLLVIFVGVTPTVVAQSTSFPQGTWVSQDAQDALAVSRNAGVEFTFLNGRYEIRRDGEVRVWGRYTSTDGQITITDVEGPWACATADMSSATYGWVLAEGQLVLTPIGADPCNRRRNRLSGTGLIRDHAPRLADTIPVPSPLRERWQRFWLQSESAGWVDEIFDRNAIAEDGNRRLVGIEQIRQWLGGQDSRRPQAFPFHFSSTDTRIVEKGRYRDIFGSPGGSTRVLVGRYQITWTRMDGSQWKVTEWILR